MVPELCSIFTLPNAVYNTELERNRDYKVSISHIVGITEFYVQSPDNLKDLMDHQERIQDLAEENKKTPTGSDCFRVGDFVLVNYLVDQCWYRGLITALNGHLCNVSLNLISDRRKFIHEQVKFELWWTLIELRESYYRHVIFDQIENFPFLKCLEIIFWHRHNFFTFVELLWGLSWKQSII